MEPLDLWRARLDRADWPPAEGLPEAERERARALRLPEARRRWVAARWALRLVLGSYLGRDPAAIELRFGAHGKPALAGNESLRFNLSHSGELAVIAVSGEREVGVDVQRLGAKPAEYYAAWVRREAIAKCQGVGIWGPPPVAPVAVSAFEAGAGFAAAVAVAGEAVPPLRLSPVEPRGGVSRSRRACGDPSSPCAAA